MLVPKVISTEKNICKVANKVTNIVSLDVILCFIVVVFLLHLRETHNTLKLPVFFFFFFFFFFSFFCYLYLARNYKSVLLILKISQFGESWK